MSFDLGILGYVTILGGGIKLGRGGLARYITSGLGRGRGLTTSGRGIGAGLDKI